MTKNGIQSKPAGDLDKTLKKLRYANQRDSDNRT